MNKTLGGLVAGVALAVAPGPARATPCTGGGVNLSLGSEQVESFSSNGCYEFIFTIPAGSNEYLDMAFGGPSSDTYSVELKANPGGYDNIETFSGGTSTQWSPAIGPGTWNAYVTLSAVAADPFGGFEISNSPLDLTISTSLTPTPLPSTWTMLIAGFLGLGFFVYCGSRSRSGPIAT